MNTLTCSLEFIVLGVPVEMPVRVDYRLEDSVDVRSVRLGGQQMIDQLEPRHMAEVTRQVLEYEGVLV
jgi:hypothetical protein